MKVLGARNAPFFCIPGEYILGILEKSEILRGAIPHRPVYRLWGGHAIPHPMGGGGLLAGF